MARPPLRYLDVESVPGRPALSPAEAAEALGISRSHFDAQVLPELAVVYCGARRLIPVRELDRYLEHHAIRMR